MSAANVTIRDALYEAPGPKTKKRIVIFTAVSLVALAALIFLIIRQFYITGQLNEKYWSLFTRFTTWKFLAEGLVGTLQVALVSSVVAFVIAFLLMVGRINRNKIVSWISTALIELSRGIPTLLFIYFFFLVAPQLGLKLPTFFCCRRGCRGAPFRCERCAQGTDGGGGRTGYAQRHCLYQDRVSPGVSLRHSVADFGTRHRIERYHVCLCGQLCGPVRFSLCIWW